MEGRWQQGFEIEVIGRVTSPYEEKFMVPRQPNLVESARGQLIFEPAFRRAEALEGISACSHLWLTFIFHEVPREAVKMKARPPRLGGNKSVGIWATRSPFRPNRLGLSVVKLLGVEDTREHGQVLHLGGLDLVNGTPVVDLKPYLGYCDSLPEARHELAPSCPERLEVDVCASVAGCFRELPAADQQLVLEVLSQDSRPSYHRDGRLYRGSLAGYHVEWRVDGQSCLLVGLKRVGDEEKG